MFPPGHNPSNPASLFAVWAEFASLYYPWTGNRAVIDHVEWMLLYMIANGTTPDDVSWAWPRVPFASSEPNATVYGGFADNGSGSGDGLGVLETDKVGGLGWAYLYPYRFSAQIQNQEWPRVRRTLLGWAGWAGRIVIAILSVILPGP